MPPEIPTAWRAFGRARTGLILAACVYHAKKPDTSHQSVWFRNGLLLDAVWVWMGGSRVLVNNMFSQN
jgi:hypothetical protein